MAANTTIGGALSDSTQKAPGRESGRAAEIDALVHAGRSGGFAIAPDAAGVGTNALCLVSAHPFRFQFGSGSQRLHLQEAEHAGLKAQVVRLPGLAFDVDSPADLNQLDRQQWLARLQA